MYIKADTVFLNFPSAGDLKKILRSFKNIEVKLWDTLHFENGKNRELNIGNFQNTERDHVIGVEVISVLRTFYFYINRYTVSIPNKNLHLICFCVVLNQGSLPHLFFSYRYKLPKWVKFTQFSNWAILILFDHLRIWKVLHYQDHSIFIFNSTK